MTARNESQPIVEKKEEKKRTEEVRKPLVVDLELLVADTGDEADDVPLGAESEDVREETERHHARPDGEGRRSDVPATAVIGLNGDGPHCSIVRRLAFVSERERR